MRNTLLTQIALISISVVIIMTYIRPTFANIRVVQDEIFQYADATAKAAEFNAHLQQLLARERSFSNDDIGALEMFLPATLDQLGIMQDIDTIVTRNNGSVVSIESEEAAPPMPEPVVEEGEDPEAVAMENRFTTQDYKIVFINDHRGFVDTLRELESLAYMLEVRELKFGAVDGKTPITTSGTLTEYTLTVRAYSFTPGSLE